MGHAAAPFFLLILAIPLSAQLNQNCTVSVLNRSVPVNPDGSWVLPNIPANFGQVKARATCVQNGVTTFGESAFFTIAPNSAVNLPAIVLGNTTPIPVSLTIGPAAPSLTTAGQAVQLAVTATYPDGSTADVTAVSAGANYTISNPAIATISAAGLVTAVSSGTVLIQANNDGATGITTVQINIGGATVGGIPVSWALAYGLNPNDTLLPQEDPDRDGLTNLQEYQLGTNPVNPDTDGDGLNDGDEVNKYRTSPLLADTDGDLIPDGVEIATGTNPLDPKSYDLAKATATSTVTPPSFSLMTSIANPVVSVQLNWKVTLIDGKTTLDLTADTRTQYQSSNLSICDFQVQPGQIDSGSSTGNCTITISQNTLSVTVPGTVTAFTPAEISTLTVPGAVAVDIAGTLAYVAAGTNGLVVVDVNDRTMPATRGTLTDVGNAQHVRANSQNVFIADQTGFLRIAQAQNPDSPTLVASLPIAGVPTALALHGALLAVAAQAGGVSLVDVTDPTNPALIAKLATPSPALGVDFDPSTGLAAIAMGTSGVQIADFSIPSAPRLRGALAGGDVLRVLVRLPAVLLADTQRSVTAVDVSNPDQPALSVSLASNLGGVPVDIAAFGNIAITADDTFGRAVPIISIADPLNPSTLTFWTLLSPGYSSSIAVDISYGYLIVPALNLLRILKYQNIEDTLGIPPTISITAPVSGTTLIQGQTLMLSANASDDVAVAGVSFFVNGQLVSATQAVPYQFNYKVPVTATSLTFGATAVDYGNNVGTAVPVTVPVIPDPLTTVTGRIVDSSGNPVAGAPVTLLTFSTASASDGTFSIAGVPTIDGNLVVQATSVIGGIPVAGYSAALAPVLGGVTAAGNITLLPAPFISTLLPKSALAGTVASASVTGFNLLGSTFSFSPAGGVTITAVSIDPGGHSATLTFDILSGASGRYVLNATNPAGPSNPAQKLGFIAGATSFNTLTVPGADPNADPDEDGLSNSQEIAAGTDPLNDDTDLDLYPDGLEVLFGSNPLDPASIPVLRQANGSAASAAFSIDNAIPPASGQQLTYAISGLPFSILNAVSPATSSQRTYSISGLTFSILNAVSPATSSQRTYAISGLTFSLLNSVSPATSSQRTYSISGLTFSILNSASPATSAAQTYAISGLPFSILNAVSPATSSQRTYSISGLTFSIVNAISPAPSTPFTWSFSGPIFSILNGTPSPSARTPATGSLAYLVPIDPVFLRDALARGAQTRNGKPICVDSDGDGLCDSDELRMGTNPFLADSDGDGYPDGLELILGSDPLDPRSIPDIRPPGYFVTRPVSIYNTIPIARLAPRRQGAINARNLK